MFTRSNKWEDCKRFCPRPDVVLDCGANVGQTAVNLRKAYPDATIYGFEPVAAAFAELRARAAALGIHPVPLAVADFNGPATMHLTASPESHSLLGFLTQNNPLAEAHRIVGQEVVQVCRLDDWCRRNHLDPRRIDLLKMDVQGSELQALHGATDILETVKIVLLEVAFVPFYEGCPLLDDMEAFLGPRGFLRPALYPSICPEIWADALYIRAGSCRPMPPSQGTYVGGV